MSILFRNKISSKLSKYVKFSENFSDINSIGMVITFFDVNIIPCDEDGCYISGEILEEFSENLSFDKINGDLKIKTPRVNNYSGPRIGRMDIKIGKLNKLSIEAHGACECDVSIPVQDLSVKGHGSGKYIISDAAKAEASISGSGQINIDNISTSIIAKISGSGSINIDNISTNFIGKISGSGNININNGNLELLDISISGSGSLNANASVQKSNV